MKIPTRADAGASGINLTPLIDVVFLLLIFFMVTASFREDERELDLDVPEAAHGDPVRELPELLRIGVRSDGRYLVGERTLDREEIGRLLDRARRKNAEQRALLRVDGAAAFTHFAFLLDLCKGKGIPATIGLDPREER